MNSIFNLFSRKISLARKIGISLMNNPEIGSKIVRESISINSRDNEGKIITFGDKKYRIKELG